MDVVVTEPPPSRRRRRRDEVRSRVERLALDLFRRHGFEEVTVERIAARAGVGPTTFYRYFGTKDGVLFAYQAGWLADVRRAAEAVDTGAARADQMTALVTSVVRTLEPQLEVIGMRDEIIARNPVLLPRALAVQRAWEQELAGSLAVRRGLAPDDLCAAADAAVVLLVLRMGLRRWRAGTCGSLADGVAVALDDMRRVLPC